MAGTLYNSRMTNKMKNYTALRGSFKKKPREDEAKIYGGLNLLSILLTLIDLQNVNEAFKDRFEKLLEKLIPRPSDCTEPLAPLVKEVLKSDCYEVVKDKNSSFSIKLPLSDTNQPSLTDDEIYSLLKECEQIFVEVHKPSKGTKEHLPSCAICLNDKFLKNIIDDEKKSSQGPIQDKVTSEFTGVPSSSDFGFISTSPGQQTEKRRGPAPSSRIPSETSDKVDEKSKGHVRRQPVPYTEETAGAEAFSTFCTFTQHKITNKKKDKEHKRFFRQMKPTLLEESCERWVNDDPSDYVLTFHNTDSNKIEYRFFDDEQKALWWAYENVHRKGENSFFIKVWDLESENSSNLNTDDLMTLDIQLIHPLKPDTVITKRGMYDTGADFASFPFDPRILQTFIHSATKINGKTYPIVYAQLSINGNKLKNIYKVDLDPDETWCAIGSPQMADLDKVEVKNIVGEIESVIISKKE